MSSQLSREALADIVSDMDKQELVDRLLALLAQDTTVEAMGADIASTYGDEA